MNSSLPPFGPPGSDPMHLGASVRAIGQALSEAYADPQPEVLARLHDLVAILDRVARQ